MMKHQINFMILCKKNSISGGSAANTIYGLSQLNCKCAFIGEGSNDALGDIFNDLLSSDIEYY